MAKKHILLLVVILALTGAVVSLNSDWRSSLSIIGHLTGGTEYSSPTHEATSIGRVPSAAPTSRANSKPASSLIPTQADQSPICFTPAELPPFAFSPDASGLWIRSSSGVQLFDLASGSLDTYMKSTQNITAAALSPDGKTLAWALQDGTIQLIELATQKNQENLIGHTDPVYDLQFSPAGDRLFSASHDGMVRIWDLDGNLQSKIEAGSEVLGIGISQDGSRLATIPFDGPISLWDLLVNTKVMEFAGSGGYDTSDARFSPDGQYLAADLATGIYMWRLADANLVWHQVLNSMAVTFSPDGQYLAYSDVDDHNKVVLAAPESGQTIRVIDEMQSPVWELFFSPDSTLLAVTDGVEIRIWRILDGTLLAVGKSTCP